MESFVSSLKLFLRSNYEFYMRYPSISQPDELRVYYRMQNKSFPGYFFMFAAAVMCVQTFSSIVSIFEGMPLLVVVRMFTRHITIDIILLLISHYIARVSLSANLPENKRDDVFQARVRTKYLICALIPTVVFTLSPFTFSRSGAMFGNNDIAWMHYILAQLYVSTWSIASLTCKISATAVFSIGYCLSSWYMGAFRQLLITRATLPIAMVALCIIALDSYMKQNFLLRRDKKRQKRMYQHFMSQMQDPILIFNGPRLAFRNRAARDMMGVTAENYATRLRQLRTAHNWTLEDVVREVVGDSREVLSGVKIERYYLDSAIKKRRTMQVTITESVGVAVTGEKTTSVVLHDISEELEAQERKDEEKYKNMMPSRAPKSSSAPPKPSSCSARPKVPGVISGTR